MKYKNAFRCKKCPESNTENGCPMWWEIAMTNVATGQDKIDKGCGYQMLPVLLVEVIKASNRPAAAFEGLRNNVVKLARNTALANIRNQAELEDNSNAK